MSELQLSREDLELLETLDRHQRFNAIDFWTPYPKQLEFIALGKTKAERMLFAGNQLGKSVTGAYETAMHLTGLYPQDWPGRKWDCPVKLWAAGVTAQSVRNINQALLCGPIGDESALGTGFIPKRCLIGKPSSARGSISDAFDTVKVQHFTNGIADGTSQLQFKSYEQGRPKFQGATLHGVWWDEEPPMDVYVEGNARWSATSGMSWMTFTPLLGMSSVVKRFLYEHDYNRGYLTLGIGDALHMTPEMRKDLLSKYPEHEWPARINGEPMLGEGRIFLTDEAILRCPALN